MAQATKGKHPRNVRSKYQQIFPKNQQLRGATSPAFASNHLLQCIAHRGALALRNQLATYRIAILYLSNLSVQIQFSGRKMHPRLPAIHNQYLLYPMPQQVRLQLYPKPHRNPRDSLDEWKVSYRHY